MKNLVRILLLLAVTLIFASSVYAEVKLDYGAAFRLRQEIWDNVVTLNTIALNSSGADRNFFRLRTSLWGKADFTPDLGAYLRLTNEAKYYGLGPYRAYKFRDPGETNAFDPDELVVDNLYADAKNIFGLPVDIRIGRQDFIGTYGEGFLIMDGTPGDGSRTFYFNAAKANVRVNPCFNFDLTYISDPKTDIYLPSMHPAVTQFSGNFFQYVNNKKVLTASNEQAFVAYGRGKLDGLTVEPYYIYKTEQSVVGGIDTSKLKLNTIGARLLYSVNSWKFGGEFAHQWGDYDSTDRSGNGGYIFAGRNYDNVTWKPEWELRYVYLSGDDPNTTNKVETWDPLFSRNPYWNELIIYTLIPETEKFGGKIPGYWTNMEILKATVKLTFNPCTNLALAYQYLWAPETSGVTGGAASMFGTGKSRGHLPTAILNHKLTKNLDGMLQFEYFVPGSFYADNADNAIFFRWQLQLKI